MKSVDYADTHDTKGLKRGLVMLRALQVILSLLAFFGSCWTIVVLAEDLARLNRLRSGHAERKVVGAQMAVVAVLLFVSFLSLTSSLTRLIFTASDKARRKASCCGNHDPCTYYKCDMAWDIVLGTVWGVLFAVAVVGAVAIRGQASLAAVGVVGVIFYAAVWVSFVVTAIMTKAVKRRLQSKPQAMIQSV